MRHLLLAALVGLLVATCGTTPGSDVPGGTPGSDAEDSRGAPPEDAATDGEVPAEDADGEPARDARREPADDPTPAPDVPGDGEADADVDQDVDAEDPPSDVPADTPDPDADPLDPCTGPLRTSPTSGPTTGGTIVEAVGEVFYIGALDWWMRLGDDVWLNTIYGSGFPSMCTLRFMTLPHEAGTFPVWVFYGEPGWPVEPPELPSTGTFTFVDTGEPVGSGPCRSDEDCSAEIEVCEIGLGRCIRDRCLASFCSGDWTRGPCDPLVGCLDEVPRCTDDDECRLIYSSCACQAVHVDDPRRELDECDYDGCATCGINACEGERVVAVCDDGRCTERRPGD